MRPNIPHNINNFNEGITSGIRNPELKYQFNGLGREINRHGWDLSLVAQSGTDAAHVVGNVTAIILQFIVDLFPQGTFKTAIPSTKIAHRQLKHTPKQIRTHSYPICIVNPRISWTGLDNRLAAGSFATSLWNTTSNRFQNRSEMPKMLFDRQKGIEWRGKLNRVVCYFDFVLSFRSVTEQLNWASYLINRIPTEGGFFDIDTMLALAIPDEFIQETAQYAGFNINWLDEKRNVSELVDYLNIHSEFPVGYRFSSGRHTDAFYAFYGQNLLCNIHELSYGKHNKAGHVEDDCPITFTVRCEFNTIGLWDLSVPNPALPRIRPPEMKNAIAIPLFSDIANDADFPLLYGWKIHSKPFVRLDFDQREIYIGNYFSVAMNNMIDYHLENGLDPGILFDIKLRSNRCIIEDGYYVDWETRKLIFTEIDYTVTYRMIFAINSLYFNDLIKDLYQK